MKAYLTTIGERTTEVAAQTLKLYGFDVVILDGFENWIDKYKRFIDLADNNCIRLDADVIINQNIVQAIKDIEKNCMMAQWHGYDFYRNNIGIVSPVFYHRDALEIIRKNFGKLNVSRPEATAWRLPDINPYTVTKPDIVAMHGFFQTKEDLLRHKANKINRKQIDEYNFELAEKLIEFVKDDI